MPLPAPGPPRTKRTVTEEGEKVGVSFLGAAICSVVGGISADNINVSESKRLIDVVCSGHEVSEASQQRAVSRSWPLKAALEMNY